jgi:glutamyl-tRNA reductase
MLRLLEDSCALQIGVLGLNFKTAGLDLQEEMARGASSLFGEKGFFFRCPTIILSTCNRTEIYFSGEDLASIHSDLLAWLRSLIQESFEHRLYSYFGIDCFSHLCRVVSGLDSAILAETEIQRQVKVAYQQTAQCLSLPSSLHYIFQKALKVGKAVRNQFPLQKGSPSLFSVIWHLTQEFFKDKLPRSVLFVGYSELTRLLIPSFLRKGIEKMTLCTKRPSSVQLSPCAIVGREALYSWSKFDLIICASKADGYLIQGSGTPGRLVFDLSVPRNVDPSIGQTSQLYNMEQINACIERNLKQHMIYVGQGEELIKTNVRHLVRIYRHKQMAQSSIRPLA